MEYGVRLCLRDTVRCVQQFARLLGCNRPLHCLVHGKKEDNDQSSHDKCITQHEAQTAAPEYILLVQSGVSNL